MSHRNVAPGAKSLVSRHTGVPPKLDLQKMWAGANSGCANPVVVILNYIKVLLFMEFRLWNSKKFEFAWGRNVKTPESFESIFEFLEDNIICEMLATFWWNSLNGRFFTKPLWIRKLSLGGGWFPGLLGGLLLRMMYDVTWSVLKQGSNFNNGSRPLYQANFNRFCSLNARDTRESSLRFWILFA